MEIDIKRVLKDFKGYAERVYSNRVEKGIDSEKARLMALEAVYNDLKGLHFAVMLTAIRSPEYRALEKIKNILLDKILELKYPMRQPIE